MLNVTLTLWKHIIRGSALFVCLLCKNMLLSHSYLDFELLQLSNKWLLIDSSNRQKSKPFLQIITNHVFQSAAARCALNLSSPFSSHNIMDLKLWQWPPQVDISAPEHVVRWAVPLISRSLKWSQESAQTMCHILGTYARAKPVLQSHSQTWQPRSPVATDFLWKVVHKYLQMSRRHKALGSSNTKSHRYHFHLYLICLFQSLMAIVPI